MGHVQVHSTSKSGRPPPPPPAPRRRRKPPPRGWAAQQPNPPRCRAPSRAPPRDPWRHGRAALGGAAAPSVRPRPPPPPPRRQSSHRRSPAARAPRGPNWIPRSHLRGPTFSGLRVAGTAVRLFGARAAAALAASRCPATSRLIASRHPSRGVAQRQAAEGCQDRSCVPPAPPAEKSPAELLRLAVVDVERADALLSDLLEEVASVAN